MEINCPSCNEAVLITDEDMTATAECPFCQQRIEFDEAEPPPINELKPPKIQPEALTSERSLLEWGSVRVTDKRVIIGARTYACRQIASVGIATDFKGPKLVFGKPAVAVGFLSWGPALVVLLLDVLTDSSLGSLTAALVGICMLAAIIITVMCFLAGGKPRYWLEIATASGREQALLCPSDKDAKQVYDAINIAIIDS
jgi:hypothetical protein